MSSIISRADTIRPMAEAVIDRSFGERLTAIIGPLGPLHLLKRAQAEAGQGALLDGDRDAILDRAAEQDAELAALDAARRAMKQRVRLATTAAQIRAIMGELNNLPTQEPHHGNN